VLIYITIEEIIPNGDWYYLDFSGCNHDANVIMFIRSIKVPSSSGVVHEYVRVVESVRENGRVKQKLVLNLGRRDTLMTLLPMLQRFLQGDAAPPLAHDGPLQALEASTWGPVLVVRHFFQQLGLWQLLDSCRRWRRLLPDEDPDDDWPSRALALIANRLLRPVSEHALAGWLETDYVCDRFGRRYLPHWKQQGRVQVDLTVLQYWYRTLDHLILNQANVELALYGRLRDLFHFQPDLVFYDLTSTYFEGHGPATLAKHGYSRDGKPRNVQVVVGVVMVAGWPIAHHVWAGNTRDSKSVAEVVKDLTQRFQFRRAVFVGDRGMVTEKNLDVLQTAEGDWGFLLGMTRRQNPEAEALIDRVAQDRWLDCPSGSTARRLPSSSEHACRKCPVSAQACACSWSTATNAGPTSNGNAPKRWRACVWAWRNSRRGCRKDN
jgi:hypothetical protein